MHTSHVSSGGRYPVLRTLAILYLAGAVTLLVVGVWRAIRVLTISDPTGYDVFGATPDMGSRMFSAFSWVAASFIGVLAMFAVAELIKLLIDIEHNTRVASLRAMTTPEVAATFDAPAASTAANAGNGVGEGVPGGGRIGQFLEGEETAEGALLRGH